MELQGTIITTSMRNGTTLIWAVVSLRLAIDSKLAVDSQFVDLPKYRSLSYSCLLGR